MLWKHRCLCPSHSLPEGVSPAVSVLKSHIATFSVFYEYRWHTRCIMQNTLHEVSTVVLISGCTLFIMAGGSFLVTFSSIFVHSFSTSNLQKEWKVFMYILRRFVYIIFHCSLYMNNKTNWIYYSLVPFMVISWQGVFGRILSSFWNWFLY